jgi:putative DNA primase/helicase
MNAPFVPPESAKPPNFIVPNFDNMPAELKELPNWVLWAAVWNGTKWGKRPVQVTGFPASTTNPGHWSTFDTVRQAYERAVAQGGIDLRDKNGTRRVPIGGVGFVFDGTPDEHGLVFGGVDFDGVVAPDGVVDMVAAERIKGLNSYDEFSVSGRGFHVIVKTRPLVSGVSGGGVELYTDGRFFTMTGELASGAGAIRNVGDEFAALAAELKKHVGHYLAR